MLCVEFTMITYNMNLVGLMATEMSGATLFYPAYAYLISPAVFVGMASCLEFSYNSYGELSVFTSDYEMYTHTEIFWSKHGTLGTWNTVFLPVDKGHHQFTWRSTLPTENYNVANFAQVDDVVLHNTSCQSIGTSKGT